MVTSRWTHCNVIYMGLLLKSVRKLHVGRNTLAQLLSSATKDVHITPIWQPLHWLPMSYHELHTIYKALLDFGTP